MLGLEDIISPDESPVAKTLCNWMTASHLHVLTVLLIPLLAPESTSHPAMKSVQSDMKSDIKCQWHFLSAKCCQALSAAWTECALTLDAPEGFRTHHSSRARWISKMSGTFSHLPDSRAFQYSPVNLGVSQHLESDPLAVRSGLDTNAGPQHDGQGSLSKRASPTRIHQGLEGWKHAPRANALCSLLPQVQGVHAQCCSSPSAQPQR